MESDTSTPARDGESSLSLKGASLSEVAAEASRALANAGIPVAVVGGSAVTLHAPDVYTSKDIDFAALRGTTRRAFAEAVAPLGFSASGRDFVHDDTPFTLDLVADTPYIDRRPVTTFVTVKTPHGPVTVYKFEDAIADRIAAFLHWGDLESLEIAERALRAQASKVRWAPVESALRQLDVSLPEAARRLDVALDRLKRAYRPRLRRKRGA
ncbi:MAG TPA: hypothetical protein VFO25_00080 [Candidatus Eremiobacteraceae bacterium]|nr:hypothetical protein [Candidatus Eremiobacteraceae bacterium]